jgi:hypothetical protein
MDLTIIEGGLTAAELAALRALGAQLQRVTDAADDFLSAYAEYMNLTEWAAIDPRDIGTADETEQNRMLRRM